MRDLSNVTELVCGRGRSRTQEVQLHSPHSQALPYFRTLSFGLREEAIGMDRAHRTLGQVGTPMGRGRPHHRMSRSPEELNEMGHKSIVLGSGDKMRQRTKEQVYLTCRCGRQTGRHWKAASLVRT